MARGRCPGCGSEGSSKAITSHMSGCSRYAQLFASGAELLSPEDEFRRAAAERAVSAVPRAPRAARPEVSEPGATVAPAPKRTPRRAAPLSDREPGPVHVEVWRVPQSL